MFKNIIVSGVKSLVEGQLNKSNQGGIQPPHSSDQSNMNYGGGYNQGGYPPQGYPQQGGGYPPQGGYQPQQQGGYPQQSGYQPQQGYPTGGPTELNYSSAPTPTPYPSSSPYPSAGVNGSSIGFNVGGGVAPYPPSGPGYPSAPSSYPQSGGYPSAPSYPSQPGYPQGASSYPQQGGYPPPSSSYSQFGGGYGNPAPSAPGIGQQQGMWGNPSIKPYPAFNANVDAETLRKAMKGFGCDNNKVIQVLCARTNGQRQDIARAFKTMYGKDLLSDLKSELHGDFEDVILALMERPAVYDAMQLRKAMEGLGTRESVLIEIMTTRTNTQIGELRYVYKQLYGSELERDLIGETSGHFKRLLISLCAGGRDESMHIDPVRANHDARKLYQAGEGRLGTDESTFNAILASQNYGQLRLVFDEYHKVCNRSIEQSIHNEFSGDIRDGLLAVCAVVRSKAAYFATLLHNSMKGFGTRDGDLIRAVVTRCEVDMVDIRTAFEGMYKQPLEKMIKGDCSGSYKDALIALVRGN